VSSDPDPAARPAAEPPPTKPPRSALTPRDMVGAVLVLVVLVLLFAGVTRSCSFAPTGPTVDPAGIPVVDAPARLRELRVGFPVRIPAVPPGWRSNSVGVDRIDGERAVRTGYLTPDGRYLRLLQSVAAEPALLAVEAGANAVVARGPVDVAGQRWVVYERGSGEPIWIADVQGGDGTPVRLLITGSGTEDEVRALAGATLAGELLPARTP
jgi:hypothetical protein